MTSAYRRILVPGISTLVMLAVLLGLGTWQVHRLHWKETLLARIATAEAGSAVPLTQNPEPYTPEPYTKLSVTGRYRFDRVAEFGAEVRDTRAGPTIGFHQIVPLDRDGAPTILVDRGWVPQKRETPIFEPAGVVNIDGYVRPAEQAKWFSAADDPAARQFYTLDPRTIGAAVGIPDPAPFILVALGESTTGAYPAPAQHLPRPPNNHLSYVITWYGLAAALLVIFGVWVRKAVRA